MHWNYRLVRYREFPDTLGLHEVFYNRAGEPCGMSDKPCGFVSDWSTEDGTETPQTDVIGSLEMALEAAREAPIVDEPAEWAKFDHETAEAT